VQETFTLVVNQSFNCLPFFALLVITALLCRGIEENAKLASVMVYIKLGVIALFVGSGLVYLAMNPHVLQMNWWADGVKTFAPEGWNGIFKGAALMFFAYIGFDALATTSEEVKNPQRDLPIGILGSLVVCTLLYILVAGVVTAILPLDAIRSHKEAAMVYAMTTMHVPVADWIVNIGAIIGITSVLLVMQLASVRVCYAIARDGLLPKKLSNLHPKFGVPILATLIIGITNAIGSGILPISLMAHVSNLGTLFAFMMVCVSVAVLRIKRPQLPRPFKAPAGLLVSVLGALGCLKLMLDLNPTAWVLTGALTLVGLVFYFVYGIKHSHLNQS
jgi:basic amino acid/polyamine antiporter, APA family